MKIFSMLSLNDLSNVILVCKKWKKVAESPWLWRRMEIVVGQLKVLVGNFKKELLTQMFQGDQHEHLEHSETEVCQESEAAL